MVLIWFRICTRIHTGVGAVDNTHRVLGLLPIYPLCNFGDLLTILCVSVYLHLLAHHRRIPQSWYAPCSVYYPSLRSCVSIFNRHPPEPGRSQRETLAETQCAETVRQRSRDPGLKPWTSASRGECRIQLPAVFQDRSIPVLLSAVPFTSQNIRLVPSFLLSASHECSALFFLPDT